MSVLIRYFTDPVCPASWAAEPLLRRLQVEFGDEARITYVMGGLARQLWAADHVEQAREWIDAADRSEMPLDPRLWWEGPLGSSYPACMAVKAAQEQGPVPAERLLRGLREGIFCRRRKLDTTEALVEEARAAGLDVERFRVDLASNAIVELLGADLERARDVPTEARGRGGVAAAGAGPERVVMPSLAVEGEGGGVHWAFGGGDGYEPWRAAVSGAGARPVPEPAPDVLGALRRFGSMATVEVAQACELPGPRAAAELWRLATEWRVRPERILTGTLWQLA